MCVRLVHRAAGPTGCVGTNAVDDRGCHRIGWHRMATIVAAVPAAMALGPGSETRLPMAVAIIGGMVLSTPLSLFVVPAFYAAVTRKHKRSVDL